jgi:hypothetical protein
LIRRPRFGVAGEEHDRAVPAVVLGGVAAQRLGLTDVAPRPMVWIGERHYLRADEQRLPEVRAHRRAGGRDRRGIIAALLIGVVAGLYPALRTARLSPTQALRTV